MCHPREACCSAVHKLKVRWNEGHFSLLEFVICVFITCRDSYTKYDPQSIVLPYRWWLRRPGGRN